MERESYRVKPASTTNKGQEQKPEGNSFGFFVARDEYGYQVVEIESAIVKLFFSDNGDEIRIPAALLLEMFKKGLILDEPTNNLDIPT